MALGLMFWWSSFRAARAFVMCRVESNTLSLMWKDGAGDREVLAYYSCPSWGYLIFAWRWSSSFLIALAMTGVSMVVSNGRSWARMKLNRGWYTKLARKGETVVVSNM